MVYCFGRPLLPYGLVTHIVTPIIPQMDIIGLNRFWIFVIIHERQNQCIVVNVEVECFATCVCKLDDYLFFC